MINTINTIVNITLISLVVINTIFLFIIIFYYKFKGTLVRMADSFIYIFVIANIVSVFILVFYLGFTLGQV